MNRDEIVGFIGQLVNGTLISLRLFEVFRGFNLGEWTCDGVRCTDVSLTWFLSPIKQLF